MFNPTARAEPTISIDVVRRFDDLTQVFVLRGLVFGAEQSCPYDEEFDGNDFSATHLIARVDGEPAGTFRIRWFADFAKAERAAVRPEFRRYGICRKMTDFAARMAARKGYHRLYGTAQLRVLDYWRSLGFEPLEKPRFAFSDHEYVPIVRQLAPEPAPLGEYTPDLVLNRPEGDWDRPGVLDRSAVRTTVEQVARTPELAAVAR